MAKVNTFNFDDPSRWPTPDDAPCVTAAEWLASDTKVVAMHDGAVMCVVREAYSHDLAAYIAAHQNAVLALRGVL
jgi:hypothetical protein